MNYNNNFDSVNFILNKYLFSNKQFELSHSNQNQFDRNNVGYYTESNTPYTPFAESDTPHIQPVLNNLPHVKIII